MGVFSQLNNLVKGKDERYPTSDDFDFRSRRADAEKMEQESQLQREYGDREQRKHERMRVAQEWEKIKADKESKLSEANVWKRHLQRMYKMARSMQDKHKCVRRAKHFEMEGLTSAAKMFFDRADELGSPVQKTFGILSSIAKGAKMFNYARFKRVFSFAKSEEGGINEAPNKSAFDTFMSELDNFGLNEGDKEEISVLASGIAEELGLVETTDIDESDDGVEKASKWQHKKDGTWWTNVDGKVVPFNDRKAKVNRKAATSEMDTKTKKRIGGLVSAKLDDLVTRASNDMKKPSGYQRVATLPKNITPEYKAANSYVGKLWGIADAYTKRAKGEGKGIEHGGSEKDAKFWGAMAVIVAEKMQKAGRELKKIPMTEVMKPRKDDISVDEATQRLADAKTKGDQAAASKPKPGKKSGVAQNAESKPEAKKPAKPKNVDLSAPSAMESINEMKEAPAFSGVNPAGMNLLQLGAGVVKPAPNGARFATQDGLEKIPDVAPSKQANALALKEWDRVVNPGGDPLTSAKKDRAHVKRMVKLANSINDPVTAARLADAFLATQLPLAHALLRNRAGVLMEGGTDTKKPEAKKPEAKKPVSSNDSLKEPYTIDNLLNSAKYKNTTTFSSKKNADLVKMPTLDALADYTKHGNINVLENEISDIAKPIIGDTHDLLALANSVANHLGGGFGQKIKNRLLQDAVDSINESPDKKPEAKKPEAKKPKKYSDAAIALLNSVGVTTGKDYDFAREATGVLRAAQDSHGENAKDAFLRVMTDKAKKITDPEEAARKANALSFMSRSIIDPKEGAEDFKSSAYVLLDRVEELLSADSKTKDKTDKKPKSNGSKKAMYYEDYKNAAKDLAVKNKPNQIDNTFAAKVKELRGRIGGAEQHMKAIEGHAKQITDPEEAVRKANALDQQGLINAAEVLLDRAARLLQQNNETSTKDKTDKKPEAEKIPTPSVSKPSSVATGNSMQLAPAFGSFRLSPQDQKLAASAAGVIKPAPSGASFATAKGHLRARRIKTLPDKKDTMRSDNEADKLYNETQKLGSAPAERKHLIRMVNMANAITDPAKAMRRFVAFRDDNMHVAAALFINRAGALLSKPND